MAGAAAPCRAGPNEGGASSLAWRHFIVSPSSSPVTAQRSPQARLARHCQEGSSLVHALNDCLLVVYLYMPLVHTYRHGPGSLAMGRVRVVVRSGPARPSLGRFLGRLQLSWACFSCPGRAPGSAPASCLQACRSLARFTRAPIHDCTHTLHWC